MPTASKTNVTPEALASVNCAYWAALKHIQLQAEEFTFKDHEYLEAPMNSTARKEVIMKGTQGGFTEAMVLRCLHGCIYKTYKKGVLYLFPTEKAVISFSNTRFNTLINNNPESIGAYIKLGRKSTDSSELKKVGDSFIYFRSAYINVQPGDDVLKSTQLDSIPVDKVIFDEYDRMDSEAKKLALGRMAHSHIKQERYLSQPSIHGYGIDVEWEGSNKSRWFRHCQRCNTFTSPDIEFDEHKDGNVNCIKMGRDGHGYIACKKCGEPVDIFPGEWVAEKPDNPVIGRLWSQFNSVYNDPMEILEQYHDPPDGDLASVFRLRLGQPYTPIEDKLRIQDVYNCCTGERQQESSTLSCAMGVDIGKTKHIIIGYRISKHQYEIIRVAQVKDWDDIHDLARRYNVKSAVIDIRPYEDEARRFQKAEPYLVMLCEYGDNALQEKHLDEKTMTIKAHRTSIFDATGRLFRDMKLICPRRDKDIDEFARQCCNTAKRLENNKRTGTDVYRYVKLGDEHYRNALNYFLLACDKAPMVQPKLYGGQRYGQGEPEFCRMDYSSV